MSTISHMTEEQIDALAEQGAHAACALIQSKLGQTDGDFASMYFESDARWEVMTQILKDYIRAEIAFADPKS